MKDGPVVAPTHPLVPPRPAEPRGGDSREGHEDHAVRERGVEIGGHLQGEPALADPTRTGQRDQGHIVTEQQVAHDHELLLPPDQRRAWTGEE